MVRGYERGKRYFHGGIISLASFIGEHRRAIESDLMRYGYHLKEIGHSLSWSALFSFVANAEPNSAIMKELNPDMYAWNTQLKTNLILADIWDLLAVMNANIVAMGSRKQAKKAPKYPRPEMNKDGEHYGKDAVPIAELKELFVSKRKRNRQDGK